MNISFMDFIKSLYKRINEDDIFALASQLAYSIIVSFFPFLIFLMTLIGFSSIDKGYVLDELRIILPESAYELVKTTVLEILNTKSGNLLSISLIGSLWAASSGFRAVIKGVNKAFDFKEERSFLKRAMISMLSTLILSVVIILVIIFLVFGELIWQGMYSTFNIPHVFKSTWDYLRIGIILTALTVGFMALYMYIPAKRIKWKDSLPGALFSTLGWIVVSIGFAFYVNNFANYSRLYGSIGAVFILLTWIYLISFIMILGGEINAVLMGEN